jgi:hypothetical protein
MRLLPLVVFLFLCACKTVEAPAVQKTKVEEELATLKAEFTSKLAESVKAVSDTKDSVIAAKEAQLVVAADGLFAADQAFKTIIQPTRTDLIVNNYVNESWEALGRRVPSYEKLREIMERLHRELDESKTSLESLQKTHAIVVSENAKLANATRLQEQKLNEAEQARIDLERAKATAIEAKQTELNEVNGKVIAAEREKANDRVAIQKAKMKLSMAAGALSAIAIIVALFLPLFRPTSITAAIIFGVAAVGVWYLTAEVVLVIVIVGLLGLAGYIIWNKRKADKSLVEEEKLSDALVLAMEDVKAKSPKTWDATLKPIVKDRLSKYVTKDGKVSTEPDVALEAKVNKKLMKYEAK